MSAIVNDRDVLLQAASPRVLPLDIPLEVKALTRRLKINASATTFVEDGATTTPTTITLTAVKEGSLSGTVTWAVIAGSATITGSGDTVTVTGTTVGDYATIRARVTQDSEHYDAQVTLSKTKTPKSIAITAPTSAFFGRSGPTSPTTITLTAVLGGGLTGTVNWSVIAGSATLSPSGNACVVTGATVSGYSVTIRARVTSSGMDYDAQYTLTRFGELSQEETIDLATQVTGQLAAGDVTGLGALALLNVVNLNTQTVGALNGLTQVTDLGALAYANAIAANQIGAGTLAAGVVYAGTVNASQVNAGSFTGKTFTGGTFTGGTFQTGASGERVVITGTTLTSYNASGGVTSLINDGGRSAFYGRGGNSATQAATWPSAAVTLPATLVPR